MSKNTPEEPSTFEVLFDKSIPQNHSNCQSELLMTHFPSLDSELTLRSVVNLIGLGTEATQITEQENGRRKP